MISHNTVRLGIKDFEIYTRLARTSKLGQEMCIIFFDTNTPDDDIRSELNQHLSHSNYYDAELKKMFDLVTEKENKNGYEFLWFFVDVMHIPYLIAVYLEGEEEKIAEANFITDEMFSLITGHGVE